MLTWLEYQAGKPCRACGRSWDKTTADEDAAFELAHQGGGRQTLGGGPAHCLACCPPPPLHPRQIEQLAALLRDMA